MLTVLFGVMLAPLRANGEAVAADLPKFEVVSVKYTDPHSSMQTMNVDPDGIRLHGFTLRSIIHLAYGIRIELISGGPPWLDSRGVDIDAKVSQSDVERLSKMSRDDRKAMLRPVLEERFGLKLHREQKKMPAYILAVAPKGAKLRSVQVEPAGSQAASRQYSSGAITISRHALSGQSLQMAVFVRQLEAVVGRPVIDETGLTGLYDFELKWSPDDGDDIAPGDGKIPEEPSLFAALQEQLGLKLKADRVAIDALVVDEVHLLTEN